MHKILLTFLGWILFVGNLSSQAVQVERVLNGEVSDFIYGIDQGKDGRIYLATDQGLIVYNGYSYQNYTEANGLLENFVTNVKVLDTLVFLDYFEEGLSVSSLNSVEATIDYFLTAERVMGIDVRQGRVFVITEKGDVYKYDLVAKRFDFAFKSKVKYPIGLKVLGENVLIYTDSTIQVYNKEGDILSDLNVENPLVELVVTPSAAGCFTISSTGLISFYQLESSKLTLESRHESIIENPMGLSISNKGKTLYIPTRSNGLFVFDVLDESIGQIEFRELLQVKNGLVSNSINLVFMDAQANLGLEDMDQVFRSCRPRHLDI